MDKDLIAQNLACVEGHFHSEAENDVDAALELYTNDIIFEAPAFNGLHRSFSGKEAVAKFYRELWATMADVKFQFLQRFATEDRVVDDSLVTFEVVRDGCWRYLPSGRRLKCVWFTSLRCEPARFQRKLSLIWGAPSTKEMHSTPSPFNKGMHCHSGPGIYCALPLCVRELLSRLSVQVRPPARRRL